MRRRARGFDRFGLKTGEMSLTGLGLKTRGGLGSVKVRAEGTWHHHEACVEMKRSRKDGVSVSGSYKKMDEIVPAWACIVIN